MRLFRFDAGVGRPIQQFGSTQLVLSPILRTTDELQIVCMHLEPSGVVGFHQAQPAQLFLVVQGEGWVRGADLSEPVTIHAGQAAFWESGEWHGAGSDNGMMAIVVEGEGLDPSQLIPEVLP
ncbi:MAG: cupin domain-containing protein [Ktedonobacterales bacterium]